MKTCVFFGHRWVFDSAKIRNRLLEEVEKFIQQGVKRFLMSTHGDFDELALETCLNLRKKYEDVEIVVVLTSTSDFVRGKANWSRADSYAERGIQTLTYEIETIFFKNRITFSNRRMAESADVVICYIRPNAYSGSGAKRAVNHAKRLDKQIINIYE